ncbi:MAG: hypothetical protein M1835_004748 [Candelina submexicana]|nr:MAG: hypothetical protein M1835_004748 [Candelina submexicana]
MRPLDRQNRFFFKAGSTGVGLNAPDHYLICDQQQQKWFQIVAYDESETDPDREDVDEETKFNDAIQILADNVDSLDESIHTIRRAYDGTLTFTSEDWSPTLDFPIFEGQPDEIIAKSQLDFRDRLGPVVYLVRPKYQQAHDQRLHVYKTRLTPDGIQRMWDEAQVIKRLTGHSHFAQLHKLITQDDLLHVIGFTTHYVPGETLLDCVRPFRFKWLKDFTNAIDYLNYDIGIVHGDVAARNILVDSRDSSIKIIDFDRAFMISRTGETYYDYNSRVGYTSDERDTQGVICATYDAFARFEHVGLPDSTQIEQLETWPLEISIEDVEGGFTSYVDYVLRWARQRRSSRQYLHLHGRSMELVNLGLKGHLGLGPDCYRSEAIESREWYEAQYHRVKAENPDPLRSRKSPFFDEHDYRVQQIRDYAIHFSFFVTVACIAVGLWQRRCR